MRLFFIYEPIAFQSSPTKQAGFQQQTNSSTDTHKNLSRPYLLALVPGIALLKAFPTLENGAKEAVTGTYETNAAVES